MTSGTDVSMPVIELGEILIFTVTQISQNVVSSNKCNASTM